jgi:predicted Zn-dependent protease
VPPVRSETIDMRYTQADLATRSQLRVESVGPAFDRATTGKQANAFRYLILPYDLKADGLNYVFANTFLDGSAIGIMSTIRLVPREPSLTRKRISDVTGDRLYKLMLKSIALLAGLRTDGCIMKFPRTLEELDGKPAEFCPADRVALVAAGVLKDKPHGACNVVAMVSR